MGLLDTWNEWKQDLSPYAEKAKDKIYGEKMSVQPGQDDMRRTEQGYLDQSLKYAGGKIDQAQEAGTQYFQGEKVFDPATGGPTKRTGVQSSESMKDLDKGIDLFDKGKNYAVKEGSKELDKAIPKIKETAKNAWEAMFPDEDNAGSISDADKQKILNGDKALYDQKTSALGEKDVGTLEKIMGVDFDTAKANWKDKGGMEGLMSNPAFSLGLALMQSSANGKTINQGILDNFIKSAKISEHYKDRIKARGSIIGPASEEEIGQVEAFLKSKKIGSPGAWGWIKDTLAGQNNEADYKSMLSQVAQANNARASALEAKGKKVVKDETFMQETIRIMKAEGKLKTKKKGKTKGFWSNFNINQTKVQGNTSNDGLGFRAQGGPVSAGKPYVVGEKGPEIIIPRSDGDVLTNDDSQIYAMLLASNPQLQKVSRVRAQKIMRNRFPEYFEG
jgi:hypothetical protein